MKLNKLQQLAEAADQGDIRFARAYFDEMEDKLDRLGTQINSATFAKLLKDEGFPVTENNALKAAFKKMFDEFEDLKMAVISHMEPGN